MSTLSVTVEPLLLEQVPRLRHTLGFLYVSNAIHHQVEEFPNFAWWAPETRDYILGGYWRGRKEIGLVVEATGSALTQQALLQKQLAAFADAGCLAVVLSDNEVDRNQAFYLEQGWTVLEEMHQMERATAHVEDPTTDDLRLRPFDPSLLELVTEVDRRAFPWLWWNDREDFLHYAALPEVFVLTAWQGERLMGYTSCTLRRGHGHLDRIAVAPDFQGRRYGVELMRRTLLELERRGARRVGLNTQARNQRALALYEQFGFQRSWSFSIVGTWLAEPPPNATTA